MIKFAVSDRVGEIVFDRSTEGNAFTREMGAQMLDALTKAAETTDILVLKGAGADFTTGRDRKEPKAASPFDSFRGVSDMNKALVAYPGVIVSGVRGRAHGMGIGLIMRSDIAIASDDASFGLDEVAHGIPPMFIMEAIVSHAPPKQALDIIFSGRPFGAQEALDMGIVSRVVPAAAFDAAVADYVKDLRSRDANLLRVCKAYYRKVAGLHPDARPNFALVEQTQFALRKA